MQRRRLLSTTLYAASVVALGTRTLSAADSDETFEVTRTPDEWRAMLGQDAYAVMREEATERAFTSPLLKESRDGTFACKGCALPLYSSETKYDSGTGWPSFWQAMPDAVATKKDRKLLFARTEVHCRRCGSHLGHIFDDGPKPTGKRHCLNGIALTFIPTAA